MVLRGISKGLMEFRRLGVATKWRGREMGFWRAAILEGDLKS